MTADQLRAFTARVAAALEAGHVPHPVHLSDGNEQQLIDYFERNFLPGDYVFGSWRSHYHALLAGVPEDELFSAVTTGASIALCLPTYRFYCSAIVAGQVPLAVGVALGLKRRYLTTTGRDDLRYADVRSGECPTWVHCFLGDMAAETGLFHEARRYALGHRLPIAFVVEDNELSVLTPTIEVWPNPAGGDYRDVHRYRYVSRYPHAGAAHRTEF